MMLRPVEFDAAGNPRPGEADQRGLDDVQAVNEILIFGLVLNGVDASANFRQHEHAKKLVLNPNRLPLPVNRIFRGAVCEGQGIYLAAAALIHTVFQKHRVLVRRRGHVGGQHQRAFAHRNL